MLQTLDRQLVRTIKFSVQPSGGNYFETLCILDKKNQCINSLYCKFDAVSQS